MVKGMPSFEYVHDSICRVCALGKNVKNKFPSSHTRSKGILDLVHSDLCGPMSTPFPSVGTFTMFYSLMISLVRPGFTS